MRRCSADWLSTRRIYKRAAKRSRPRCGFFNTLFRGRRPEYDPDLAPPFPSERRVAPHVAPCDLRAAPHVVFGDLRAASDVVPCAVCAAPDAARCAVCAAPDAAPCPSARRRARPWAEWAAEPRHLTPVGP